MLSSLSGVLFLGGQTPGYLKEEGQYLPRVQSEQLEVPGLTGCGDMGFVVSPLFWEGENGNSNMYAVMWELNRQSRSDVGCSLLGAGAWG